MLNFPAALEQVLGKPAPTLDFERGPFNVQRHLTSAKTHRAFRATAMQTWRDVVAAA
jgi:hypothetical protein